MTQTPAGELNRAAEPVPSANPTLLPTTVDTAYGSGEGVWVGLAAARVGLAAARVVDAEAEAGDDDAAAALADAATAALADADVDAVTAAVADVVGDAAAVTLAAAVVDGVCDGDALSPAVGAGGDCDAVAAADGDADVLCVASTPIGQIARTRLLP